MVVAVVGEQHAVVQLLATLIAQAYGVAGSFVVPTTRMGGEPGAATGRRPRRPHGPDGAARLTPRQQGAEDRGGRASDVAKAPYVARWRDTGWSRQSTAVAASSALVEPPVL